MFLKNVKGSQFLKTKKLEEKDNWLANKRKWNFSIRICINCDVADIATDSSADVANIATDSSADESIDSLKLIVSADESIDSVKLIVSRWNCFICKRTYWFRKNRSRCW
jgi:hypothetical protein